MATFLMCPDNSYKSDSPKDSYIFYLKPGRWYYANIYCVLMQKPTNPKKIVSIFTKWWSMQLLNMEKKKQHCSCTTYILWKKFCDVLTRTIQRSHVCFTLGIFRTVYLTFFMEELDKDEHNLTGTVVHGHTSQKLGKHTILYSFVLVFLVSKWQ